MTKEELKVYVKTRLVKRYARRFNVDPVWAWTQIRDVVSHLTSAEKQELVVALKNTSVVRNIIQGLADAEADDMLSNDSLDLNELTRLLGGQ